MSWNCGGQILLAYFLFISAGGTGPFVVVSSKTPKGVFETPQACQIGLEAMLYAYRTPLDSSEPIRSGKGVWWGWIEGTPQSGSRDKIYAKQIYLLTCEEFPNLSPHPLGQ